MKETLWWSFPGAAKKKQNKAASGEKTGTFEMTFTGTLIEDLIATVERAERAAQSDGALPGERLTVETLVVEPLFVESLVVEPWFASVQENRNYNSKFLGVA